MICLTLSQMRLCYPGSSFDCHSSLSGIPPKERSWTSQDDRESGRRTPWSVCFFNSDYRLSCLYFITYSNLNFSFLWQINIESRTKFNHTVSFSTSQHITRLHFTHNSPCN